MEMLMQSSASGSSDDVQLDAPPRPLLLRIRFQLLGGLLFAVLLPGLVRWQLDFFRIEHQSLGNGLTGAAVAIIIGYFLHHRFGDFPGVRSGSSLLVSLSASFAVVVLVFFLFRLEYSRFVFATSYVLSLGWFVLVHRLTADLAIPRLALIPGGNSGAMAEFPGVQWTMLDCPSLGRRGITGVVADLRHHHADEWERFMADCALAGIPVFHTKQLAESLTGKVEIEHLSENTFGSLLPNMLYLKAKQLADFALALLALPVFLLVLLVVGPLTVLSSGWPVFFMQDRVGYGGHVFRVFKFRTMRPMAADTREAAMTRDGDSRITAVGKVLRRYRIDELPQILNVLRGEMSWIGPRPEALTLSKWYEAELPFYRYRHVVRPGITGWAQVNQGHVASPDQVLEKLHYDFFYIKNVSPWLDLLIVFKTVRTILSGHGAK